MKTKLLLLTLSLIIVGARSASAVTIDDFDLGGVSLVMVGTGFDDVTQGGVGEIWTTRTTSIEVFSTPSPFTISHIMIHGGELNFSLPAGVDGTAWVEWDGIGEDFITETTVSIDFLFSDLGSDITLTIEDGSGGVGSKTLSTPDGPSMQSFMLSDYVGLVDLTDVEKIGLHLHGPLAGDYIVDEVKTTTTVPSPEPVTAGLALMGLLSLMTRR